MLYFPSQIFSLKFFFFEICFLKFSTFLQITWGFAMFHNTNDDQLIQGQNIKILKIYLNQIFSK